MADFAYGGGGEDLSGGQPFESDYLGYDPRLPSQRFDSSQRFDESFRAPDHFTPAFGDGVKEDGEGEYQSANGFGYNHADTPPSYGYEDDHAGQATGAPSAYVPTFEPDAHSDFGGDVNYGSAHPLSGNGFGANDDDNLFSSLPAGNGPILPEPEEMREEGFALREWKRENGIRLQEKERKERERLAQVVEDANYFKDEVYVKRKSTMENGRKTNREKEKVYLTNQENFHKNADKQYWKAVAELIPNELPTIDTKVHSKKDKKDKERKPSIVAIKGPKPGKPTDVTRMRQILVKLKHTPPPHMKPPPPPPAPVAEKDKDAKAKDKDGKDTKSKDGKDVKDAKDAKEKELAAAPVEADATAAPETEPKSSETETETPAPLPAAAAAAVTA